MYTDYVSTRWYRSPELLVGDASKAKAKLGWEPKITVEELVKEMVAADIELFKRDKYLLEGGHKVLNFHE